MLRMIKEDVIQRFLSYISIHTTSDEDSEATPSSRRQFDLARLLEKQLNELGLENVFLDDKCYVYGVLPASEGNQGPAISFCSHMDTSPDAPGMNVTPRIIENYNGKTITFPKNPNLILTPEESPQLKEFIGKSIITSSGDTLLGADDKAGISEIMTALKLFKEFPELKHPELRICFTPDEEVGRGVDHIQVDRLGKYCYTMDGGMMGELESECFNAHFAEIIFKGINVHPGEAKNKMVNAAAIAARFMAQIPECQSPEHTEKREGFFHLIKMEGDTNQAKLFFIIRDFIYEKNEERIELLNELKAFFLSKYPGVEIDIKVKEQYRNMVEIINQNIKVLQLAEKAILDSGVKIIPKPIRGGTDGARLSFMGIPSPNIFSGGVLFHSIKEWIPKIALEKSVETIIRLCRLWYANS